MSMQIARVEFCDPTTGVSTNLFLSLKVQVDELLELCSGIFLTNVVGFMTAEGIALPASVILHDLGLFNESSVFIVSSETDSVEAIKEQAIAFKEEQTEYNDGYEEDDENEETSSELQDDDFSIKNMSLSASRDREGSYVIFVSFFVEHFGETFTILKSFDILNDTPYLISKQIAETYQFSNEAAYSVFSALQQGLQDFVSTVWSDTLKKHYFMQDGILIKEDEAESDFSLGNEVDDDHHISDIDDWEKNHIEIIDEELMSKSTLSNVRQSPEASKFLQVKSVTPQSKLQSVS